MALTEIAVRTARAASVDRKLADEKGLYFLVTVSRSKLPALSRALRRRCSWPIMLPASSSASWFSWRPLLYLAGFKGVAIFNGDGPDCPADIVVNMVGHGGEGHPHRPWWRVEAAAIQQHDTMIFGQLTTGSSGWTSAFTQSIISDGHIDALLAVVAYQAQALAHAGVLKISQGVRAANDRSTFAGKTGAA